jgi:hypothetical protein
MEHGHLLGFLKGSKNFYASQQKELPCGNNNNIAFCPKQVGVKRTTLWERYENVEKQNANSLLVLCKET